MENSPVSSVECVVSGEAVQCLVLCRVCGEWRTVQCLVIESSPMFSVRVYGEWRTVQYAVCMVSGECSSVFIV